MKKIAKLSAAIIVLAMCVLLGTTAWAANSNGVTYTAELSKNNFCVPSESEVSITVTIKTNKIVEIDSMQAELVLPDGWTVYEAKNDAFADNAEDGFTFMHNGNLAWFLDYETYDESIKTQVLAVIKVIIPKGTKAGEHTVGLKNVMLSNNYGTEWENGVDITTTVKIQNHVDGDDNDHDCDNCTIGKNVDEGCHGGTATCQAKPVCIECGKEYGSKDATNHVTPGKVTYTNDGDTHSATYDCCGATYVSGKPHSYDGTTHACRCGAESHSHSRYEITETTHQSLCSCGKTLSEAIPHDFTKGECVCGAKEPVVGLKGDVNLDGQVTLTDAVLLTRHTLDVEIVENATALLNADVNGDGEVTLADAVKLTRYTLDLETLD